MSSHSLIAHGSPLSKSPIAIINIDGTDDNFKNLMHFLEISNGLDVFNSSLIVYPWTNDNPVHSIAKWNEISLWKYEYADSIINESLFFAEDVFANQFGIYNNEIVLLNAETGTISKLCNTFAEWCQVVIENTNQLTGLSFLELWKSRFGPLKPSCRLCPKRPIVLGGEYTASNFFAEKSENVLGFLGSIARQIRELPEGSSISISLS